MRAALTIVVATVLTTVLLAGCGGSGGNSSNGQTGDIQDKQSLTSATPVATDYQTVVQNLYVTYLGRPADPGGLNNVEKLLLNAKAPTDVQGFSNAYYTNRAVSSLVNSFELNSPYNTLYGNSSNSAFITAVYQNILGRAPLNEGLNYWVAALNNGSITRNNAALSIAAGALSNTSAAGLLDAQMINNRLTIAAYFCNQLVSQNVTAAYQGATAAANAQALLVAVNATTNMTAYEAQVSSYIAALPIPVDTVTAYQLEGANAIGSTNGNVTGGFSYDWTTSQITAFSFATPFGTLSSTASGNSANITLGKTYTSVTFANAQASMTLYYSGTPSANDTGFFGGALCTTKNPCSSAGTQLPVSTLTSKTWSSDPVWVPDMVWVPNPVWVPDMVWVSNWVWVSDMECSGYDEDGDCTGYEDDGYNEDDGGYVDEGSYVDQGYYVDEGGYVDEGAYPVDNISVGLTVVVPSTTAK